MTVRLVYRNYKPLHSMYASILRTPPKGVTVIPPPAKGRLSRSPVLFKAYRKFGRNKLARTVVKHVDSRLFTKTDGKSMDGKSEAVDLYHYINMVPENPPGKPYVVEFEHAGALFSFVFDKRREDSVKAALAHDQCKAIICSTEAAKATLMDLFKADRAAIEHKTHIIYPALDRDEKSFKPPAGLGKDKYLRLLFVGNDCYRKGLEEILVAINGLESAVKKQVRLTIISGDAGAVLEKHPGVKDTVRLLPPNYDKQGIIDNFYRKSDILLLLTKQDTFGFSVVDALSCGVPVIATKQFALPEIVSDGTDGILLNLSRSVLDEGVYYSQEAAKQVNRSNVDHKLADQLSKALAELCSDRPRIIAMGRRAVEKFQPGGRFAIDVRNRQLLDVYKMAAAKKAGWT